MAFVKLAPAFPRPIESLETPNRVENQIWQQLELLRHVGENDSISLPKEMSPWIDQAENYYKDAMNSQWRTSGLLYYYSFLNLSKAFLVGTGNYPSGEMKSTSIYHGLAAEPQSIINITDFEVKIMPPVSNSKRNIFASFYEAASKSSWPFTRPITVAAKDLLSYCTCIGSELDEIFSIKGRPIMTRGMIRVQDGKAWYEVCMRSSMASVFLENFQSGEFISVPGSTLSSEDREEWFSAYRIAANQIGFLTFFQTAKTQVSSETEIENLQLTHRNVSRILDKMAYPYPHTRIDENWLIYPKIRLNNQMLHWHTLYSDYIMAFILSTALRYQPHILEHDDKNSFIAKAWCTQSSVEAMRHFLMFFTNPMVVFN